MMADFSYEKTKAKWHAIIGTFLYSLLLYPAILGALIKGILTYEATEMNLILRSIIIISVLSIPLSMFVSICTMWSRYYVYEQYKKVRCFAFLPLVPFGIFVIVQSLYDYFH